MIACNKLRGFFKRVVKNPDRICAWHGSKIPCMCSTFGEWYREHSIRTKATMHLEHLPGERLEVDWAGQTMEITDNLTGEIIPPYVFFAAHSYSGFAYVEAFPRWETYEKRQSMTLSKKSEYTLLALVDLARGYDSKKWLSATQIAERNEIPIKFLEQILLMLKANKYVVSARGPSGGYQLSRRPQEISLAEIIRLIDGALAPVASVSSFFYESTPTEKNEKLLACFQDIRDYTARKLESTTLDQMV